MSDKTAIPFLDLVSTHQELEPELLSVVRKCLSSAAFVGGPMVEDFEREFARFCGTLHCVGVANGTDAVRFALIAAGVKRGDVVITVPNSFIATTEAISQAGAHPEFVDIDERTYGMDPDQLRLYLDRECFIAQYSGQLINRKHFAPVTAIVPVHLYGHVADMDAILQIANKHKLIVIEDACQAHGAEYFSKQDNVWRKAGSMGHAAAFSFYPGKNLGACGEAGAVTTNNEGIARSIRMLRDHGQAQKYYHAIEGYNGRLDAVQAGILSIKLRHLAEWNRKRCEAAVRYDELLAVLDEVIRPFCAENVRAVYHLYVVRIKDRDTLQQRLAGAGIGTAIHYPVPLHLQKAYSHLGYGEGSFPISERVAAEILSLPMYPHIRAEQVGRVVREIANAVTGSASKSLHTMTSVQTPAQA